MSPESTPESTPESFLALIEQRGLDLGLNTVWVNLGGEPAGQWDATHLVWIRPGIPDPGVDGGVPARPATLLAAVADIETGDGLTPSPYALDPAAKSTTVLVPESGLLTLATPEGWPAWIAARDRRRIESGPAGPSSPTGRDASGSR